MPPCSTTEPRNSEWVRVVILDRLQQTMSEIGMRLWRYLHGSNADANVRPTLIVPVGDRGKWHSDAMAGVAAILDALPDPALIVDDGLR